MEEGKDWNWRGCLLRDCVLLLYVCVRVGVPRGEGQGHEDKDLLLYVSVLLRRTAMRTGQFTTTVPERQEAVGDV